MRTVTNGNGQDSTNAVLGFLSSNTEMYIANLYLIGEPEDPESIWLTDWSTPLLWSAWGTFYPAVIPSRGTVKSEIGLTVQTMDFEWTPNNFQFTGDITSTSPYQKAWFGRYDGASFRAWTCYMPTPGDANTFGASELFGGRVGQLTVERASIKITVNSFLDVVNQMVPGSVVESTNSIAGFKGAYGPGGTLPVPTFTVASAGISTITGVGGTFALNDFLDGYVFITSGISAGSWSIIASNAATNASHTIFTLTQPLPFPPNGGDSFYASAHFPINQADGQYFGFPFVPAPEQGA